MAAALEIAFAGENHISAMDGGEPPITDCPGCWLETYGLEEGRCAVCGCEMPADAECAVYGQPLTTEEYRYNNSLCGHHKITY